MEACQTPGPPRVTIGDMPHGPASKGKPDFSIRKGGRTLQTELKAGGKVKILKNGQRKSTPQREAARPQAPAPQLSCLSLSVEVLVLRPRQDQEVDQNF